MKAKNIQHFSIFTDKGPSIAERVIRTGRNLLKKPVFEKGKADWLSELASVIEQYNKTFHHSIKVTPVQASTKANEKLLFDNLRDDGGLETPKYNLGHLVCTADIKRF